MTRGVAEKERSTWPVDDGAERDNWFSGARVQIADRDELDRRAIDLSTSVGIAFVLGWRKNSCHLATETATYDSVATRRGAPPGKGGPRISPIHTPNHIGLRKIYYTAIQADKADDERCLYST